MVFFCLESGERISLRVGIKAFVEIWRESVLDDVDRFRDAIIDDCGFGLVVRIGQNSGEIWNWPKYFE